MFWFADASKIFIQPSILRSHWISFSPKDIKEVKVKVTKKKTPNQNQPKILFKQYF